MKRKPNALFRAITALVSFVAIVVVAVSLVKGFNMIDNALESLLNNHLYVEKTHHDQPQR